MKRKFSIFIILMFSLIAVTAIFFNASCGGGGGGGGGGGTSPTPTATPTQTPTPSPAPTTPAPIIVSITDEDGDNRCSDNNYSMVRFEITGNNFGDTAENAYFVNVDTADIINAAISTWDNTSITGEIGLQNGKFCVVVKANGMYSNLDVFYYKGEGYYEVPVE